MKGFNHFLTALLPSSIESGRIKFTPGSIESSLKREDGQVIVQSILNTPSNKLNEEICIPHLSQLQKAYRTLDNPKVSFTYEQDIPSKLALMGNGSRISLFLMDKDFVSWPSLTAEPEYSLSVELTLSSLESMKTNYSLVDGELTNIKLSNSKLTFIVGNEEHENSAKTSMDIDVNDEYEMTIRSEFITAILDTINSDSVVTLNASEHGLIKIVVDLDTEDYKLSTKYFLVASQ